MHKKKIILWTDGTIKAHLKFIRFMCSNMAYFFHGRSRFHFKKQPLNGAFLIHAILSPDSNCLGKTPFECSIRGGFFLLSLMILN